MFLDFIMILLELLVDFVVLKGNLFVLFFFLDFIIMLLELCDVVLLLYLLFMEIMLVDFLDLVVILELWCEVWFCFELKSFFWILLWVFGEFVFVEFDVVFFFLSDLLIDGVDGI